MAPRVPDERRPWPPGFDAVAAARDGDDGALTAIAASGIPKLVAFYRGLGLRSHDAEDLASDTCEAIVRTLPRLRDPDRFEPWFWRVARSKFYDHLRRKQRSEQPVEREAMYDDPADSMVISDEHATIRRAFETLKTRDRELLWMRDVLDLPYSDIAGRMQLREGAIRIAVMRARQRLEEALAEIESEEERAMEQRRDQRREQRR